MPKFIRKRDRFGAARGRDRRSSGPIRTPRNRYPDKSRNRRAERRGKTPAAGGRRRQKKPESAFAYPVTFAGPGPSCFSDIADLPSRHPVRAHPAETRPRKTSGRSGQGSFLQFGFRHGTMAADVVERLAQAMHELVEILLVEEDLMPVVGRLAFGIDRLATLSDGQEIVISPRGPDIEK